jgi:hypothetical protein
MSDLTDKAKDKFNDMENKAHELKGRAKAKKEDTQDSDESDDI